MLNIILIFMMFVALFLMIANLIMKVTNKSEWYVDPYLKPVSIAILIICEICSLSFFFKYAFGGGINFFFLGIIWLVNGITYINDIKS
jgi:hypothetical protein